MTLCSFQQLDVPKPKGQPINKLPNKNIFRETKSTMKTMQKLPCQTIKTKSNAWKAIIIIKKKKKVIKVVHCEASAPFVTKHRTFFTPIAAGFCLNWTIAIVLILRNSVFQCFKDWLLLACTLPHSFMGSFERWSALTCTSLDRRGEARYQYQKWAIAGKEYGRKRKQLETAWCPEVKIIIIIITAKLGWQNPT